MCFLLFDSLYYAIMLIISSIKTIFSMDLEFLTFLKEKLMQILNMHLVPIFAYVMINVVNYSNEMKL